MKDLIAISGLMAMLAGGAQAQGVPDLRGTWLPSQTAHIVEGPTRHAQSGREAVPGHETYQRTTSRFVFRFEGQDGRTFWGVLSSTGVSERIVGALSVDGRRFVMTDEDGHFTGTVVDNDTLDYCYQHATPTNRAVACGLLTRQRP
ncbi:hypothetical protein ACE7GA_00600 [Roseomonas sp. CCTCC AB2023176]|uniref:hypothetical protein n=1 Tax=Roseomonas sp. CCTCC AB2023176 TaxID=3342640 RepID=UPI0035E2CDFF